MVLHNPNNWHWVNKDVSGWAKEYLEKDLTEISAEENGATAQVTKILSMDGDVDVSQRKGKVITLFDVKLQLEYSGRCTAFVSALISGSKYANNKARADQRRRKCQRKDHNTGGSARYRRG